MNALVEERPASTRASDGAVHIVNGEAYPAESLVRRALCGASCVVWDDGTTVPEGFDFYLVGKGHEKASCAACKRAL